MKQKQSDTFRHLYNLFTEDECWERSEKSAKHILSAIAFKESSSVSFNKTKSVLLPPIGYYYSFFHMAVALCWLDPRIKKEKLENVKNHEELSSVEFEKCFEVIDEICDLLKFKFDIKQRIKTYIADSKGDDFVQTYLSEDEQDAVMDYLVKIGYSN